MKGKRKRTCTIEAVETRQLFSTIYVDVNSSGPIHNGSSWNAAYHDLQQALSVASGETDDQIFVADGTYKPTTGTSQAATFSLKDGVSLFGGYAGAGAPNPDQRNPALFPTILSGDLNNNGQIADNSFHVVTASDTDNSAVLDGFTITAGNAQSLNRNGGAGIYISSANPTISNCILTGNFGNNGGAIYLEYSSPTLTNCTISNNQAVGTYAGGGIFALYSAPVITNCTFSGNTAGSGGGIYLDVSDAVVTNTVFTSNTAGSGGGGVYNYFANPTFTKCTFLRNVGQSSSGGGMYNDSGSPIITDCMFLGNKGSVGAGMFNVNSSWPTVTDCTFVGNVASSYGGGGMWTANGGTATLTNCTFTANKASNDGGGLYCTGWSSITNCIFWNNTAASNPQVYHSEAAFVLTYSDGSGISDTGNINSDPKFLRNPSPGSDGVWGTVDDDYGNLMLLPTSACADAGSNAAVPAGVTTDLAGNLRFVDNPGVHDPGAIVDMGAYESWMNVYVDPTATGAQNGKTWTDAFASLDTALGQLLAGQQIILAQGTYKPTVGAGRSATFQIPNSNSIRGGYAGLAGANPDARDPLAYRSILSGDIGVVGDNSDNAYHVVTLSGNTLATVLDGLVITGGNANGVAAADTYGGGIYNGSVGANLTVSSCSICGNLASQRGGGIYNSSSAPTVMNCVFTGNAANGAGGSGGAIYSDVSSPSILNCSFAGNSAASSAGAIFGPATVSNSIIWGNTAPSSAQIFSTVAITYSDIEGGAAGTGNVAVDPLFVDADGADNISGTVDDDLRLQAASPCIDAGGDSAVPLSMKTDFEGNARISDVVGVHDPGAIVDMGAFEKVGVWGVTASAYFYDTPKPSIKFNFSTDLSTSTLQAGDLMLLNLTTGQSIDCSTLTTMAYDANNRAMTWTFPNFILPDGNYRATLNSGSISDSSNQPLATNNNLDFFILAGDANHDRVVDANDLKILTANWLKTGRTYSQGDFNYDRRVDVTDLSIFAKNWQVILPPPPPPPPPPPLLIANLIAVDATKRVRPPLKALIL